MVFDLTKKPSKKAGTAPGTLAHVGHRRVDETRIYVINYNPQRLIEQECLSTEACEAFLREPGVS